MIMWSTRNTTAAICCGIALAALAACGRTASPPREGPAPGEGAETGAVSSVSIGERTGTQASSVEELLQGRVAGLRVVRLENGGYSLRIRGSTSLTGSNEPLIVVDGMIVPQTGLADALAGLSPQDVAHVEILKDAGSTALYGSRGANGVIVIHTRRRR